MKNPKIKQLFSARGSAALLLGLLLAAGAWCSSCSSSDPGRRLIGKRCSQCHTTKRIFSRKRPMKEWETIVARMIRHGAELEEAERAELLSYVRRNLSLSDKPERQGDGQGS